MRHPEQIILTVNDKVWKAGQGQTIVCCNGYNAAFFESIKEVFNVQEALHSPDTLPFSSFVGLSLEIIVSIQNLSCAFSTVTSVLIKIAQELSSFPPPNYT